MAARLFWPIMLRRPLLVVVVVKEPIHQIGWPSPHQQLGEAAGSSMNSDTQRTGRVAAAKSAARGSLLPTTTCLMAPRVQNHGARDRTTSSASATVPQS